MYSMVYMLLAKGFEETEAVVPLDVMRRAGIDVKTVSITNDKLVEGSHKIPIKADITTADVNTDDLELLYLPGGGMGHRLLDESDSVHRLINEAHAKGAYIAAICAAPSILGKKQMLSGKKATCYPGFEKFLYGAECKTDKVVKDGNIITSRGAGTAADFAFEIVKLLKDKKVAKEVREDMVFDE